MTIKKRILLISSSSKTGGGPSHIFFTKGDFEKGDRFLFGNAKN